MFDSLFDLVANLLSFFYGLVPNYAVAIALLTCSVMLITTPLTLKGTRSMIEMQRLQPEIRKLQAQYRDDRQKLNEEMMRFYKEHQINPLGGCLPLLIQLPVFSILFYMIRGLTNKADFVGVQRVLQDMGVPGISPTPGFRPKYLSHDSELYRSLLGKSEMNSFGIDLAISPLEALQDNFVTAIPYVLIVALIAGLSWYQQKQIMGRNRHAEVTPQQQMMMRLGPAMYIVFAFISPAALCIYFLVSTVWRVGQQGFITHSLYKGDDSVGAQAQKAMAQMRAERKAEKGDGARSGARTKSTSKSRPAKAKAKPSGNGTGASTTKKRRADAGAATGSGGAARPRPHPRSRKKKKRK